MVLFEGIESKNMTKPAFANLYEIPETIRILQGARLTFEQATNLIERSYELGVDGNPDMGKAKEEFYEAHEMVGDIWVAVKKK